MSTLIYDMEEQNEIYIRDQSAMDACVSYDEQDYDAQIEDALC